MANKNIQMEFTINANDYQRIVDSDQEKNPVEVFKKLAEFFFHNYANGGLLMKPQDVSRVAKSTGSPVNGPEDIIKAIELSKQNEDGQFTFKFSLDPTIVEQYRSYADYQGITIRQFMEDNFQQVIFNGWLYEVDQNNKMVAFTPSDYNTLRDLLDGSVSGKEIVKALESVLAEVK